VTDSRLYPSRPFLAASAAVFRDGKVLLASRTKPPADKVFSLPGGIVELGETLQEAALRELMEEVGVAAEVIGLAGHVDIIEREAGGRIVRHFVVNAFACRWIAGEPQTGPEAGEVRWVEPERVDDLPTSPHLARLVRQAAALL
jgi:ADP-ribose pyrophosphatase YjhB (NUDIX family)